MTDIKFNPNSHNIHNHCNLLVKDENLGINYCPYKKNPLSKAGCSLTNGVYKDSTKSKEVSNTVNALSAIGFLERINDSITLTKEGKSFGETDFYSKEINQVFRNALLKYGVFVGFLGKLFLFGSKKFNTSDVKIGYPKQPSPEIIIQNGEKSFLLVGSKEDSTVRTKSCILAWATSAGFICPNKYVSGNSPTIAHIDTKEYIESSTRSLRNYQIIDIPKNIFRNDHIVQNPLDYNNLTKNIGALRENNQKKDRETTLKYERIVKNRRLAIVYLLDLIFKNNLKIQLTQIIDFLKKFPEHFVINGNGFDKVIYHDLEISFMCGIPFIEENGLIEPLTGVNTEVLCRNAPSEVLKVLQSY